MRSVYRNILAALDPERATDTPVIAGGRLAREQGASLRVAAVVRVALLSPKGFFSPQIVDRDTLLQEAKSAVEQRLRVISTEQVPADVMIGDPGEVIAAIAEQRRCDLIVLGARARSGAEYLLGTTATDVLRLATGQDVYACHRDDPGNPTEKAIIAIDGSSITSQVLGDSARFIDSANTDVHSVHVVCVTPAGASSRAARMLEKCRAYLAESPWADVEARIETEDVVDSLDAVVRDYDADLLIIGSGGNRGIGWAIGSTTNEVLHEVSCDVLVIRADD
jgi:nucleotide-binding universal stress UspA family protein